MLLYRSLYILLHYFIAQLAVEVIAKVGVEVIVRVVVKIIVQSSVGWLRGY